MSTREVGFVTVSNHVLGAANSKCYIMLLRQGPGKEERLRIASGVLFDLRGGVRSCTHDVDLDGTLIRVEYSP
jgi:hypothetical protein